MSRTKGISTTQAELDLDDSSHDDDRYVSETRGNTSIGSHRMVPAIATLNPSIPRSQPIITITRSEWEIEDARKEEEAKEKKDEIRRRREIAEAEHIAVLEVIKLKGKQNVVLIENEADAAVAMAKARALKVIAEEDEEEAKRKRRVLELERIRRQEEEEKVANDARVFKNASNQIQLEKEELMNQRILFDMKEESKKRKRDYKLAMAQLKHA